MPRTGPAPKRPLVVDPVTVRLSETASASAGTFLTLVVVPLFYTLVDDVQTWCLRFLSDLRGLKGSPASAAEIVGK